MPGVWIKASALRNCINYGLAFSWLRGDFLGGWNSDKERRLQRKDGGQRELWRCSCLRVSLHPSLYYSYPYFFLLFQMHLHVLRYFPRERDSNSGGKISHQSRWQRGHMGDSMTGWVERQSGELPRHAHTHTHTHTSTLTQTARNDFICTSRTFTSQYKDSTGKRRH